MKKIYLFLFTLLVACGPTHDNGCGGSLSSNEVEEVVGKQFRAKVTCISDDENTYTCTDAEAKLMYRCADSAVSLAKVKCIPWFPLE